LYESEVKKAVKRWLRSEHPDWTIWSKWHFDIIAGSSKSQPLIAVECKGIPSERKKIHRAIGQCLDYMTPTGFAEVSCFMAIPKDFVYNDLILKILEYHELSIGLLTVDDNGEVTIQREAKKSHVKDS